MYNKIVLSLIISLWMGWLVACQTSSVIVTAVPTASTFIQNTSTPPNQSLEPQSELNAVVETVSSPSLTPSTTPSPTHPLASPSVTPIGSATSTLIPPSQLQACLPPKKIPETVKPMWALEVYRQAQENGDLPTKGEGVQWQMSYDNKTLIMAWQQSPNVYDLAAYDIKDKSFQIIAHLYDLLWQVSPVSDCIIVFGMPVGGEDNYSVVNPIDNFIMIDSQGNLYRFKVSPDQLEPKLISNLAWAPDGLQIAITTVTKSFNRMSLYLVSVDGQEIRLILTNVPKAELSPGEISWSPTGEQIALTGSYIDKDKIEKEGLLLVRIDTGQREWVVKEGVQSAGSIYWSSDGRYLYYMGEPVSSCYQLELTTREIVKTSEEACRPYGPPRTRP